MVPSLFILFLYVLMPGKYVTIKGDTLQRRVVYIMISSKHLNLLEYNGRDYLHGIYLFVKHFKNTLVKRSRINEDLHIVNALIETVIHFNEQSHLSLFCSQVTAKLG